MSSAFDFSAARLVAYCATIFSRLALRLTWLFFAIASSVHERELEALEKRLGFVIGPRSRVDDDIHAPRRLSLVVVDLDENDVLLEAHGVVAAAVEAAGLQAAEVAYARQRHG